MASHLDIVAIGAGLPQWPIHSVPGGTNQIQPLAPVTGRLDQVNLRNY